MMAMSVTTSMPSVGSNPSWRAVIAVRLLSGGFEFAMTPIHPSYFTKKPTEVQPFAKAYKARTKTRTNALFLNLDVVTRQRDVVRQRPERGH
jgi:hypothetical protein